MNKRIYFIVLTIIALAFFKGKYGSKQFNKKKWAEYPQERYRMTDNLIKSGILIGKTKEEVLNLLTDDCKQFSMENNSWMYYTKVKPGWRNADIEILDVFFNSGKVINVEIRK